MENILETGQRVLAAITAWDELRPGVVIEVEMDAYIIERTVPFSYTIQFDSGMCCNVEPGNVCSVEDHARIALCSRRLRFSKLCAFCFSFWTGSYLISLQKFKKSVTETSCMYGLPKSRYVNM